MTYQILWDNGNACDLLSAQFTNRRKAERWAAQWKREMVALEATAEGRKEARHAYSWEVIEVDDVPTLDPESMMDMSEFLRY